MKKLTLAAWLAVSLLGMADSLWAGESEDAPWSKPVNGIQARITMKEAKVVNDTRIISTYLTLRNVSDVGNPLTVEFNSSKLSFRVVDEKGNEFPKPDALSYSGGRYISTDLVLPFDSSLTFNVTQSGLGIPKGKAGLLDFGPEHCWIFDVSEGKKYFLLATLRIDESKRKTEERLWHGTISIPKAEVPLRN